MKKVKYKVTIAFGLSPEGEIRDAYLLFTENDTNRALIYHPKDSDGCGSLEICEKKGKYYQLSEEGYLNIDRQKNLDRIIKNLQKISYKDTKSCRISPLTVEKR